MEAIFNEEMIRAELRRLDAKTGLHAADLPIKFGDSKRALGRFYYGSDDKIKFYFSNYYFKDTNHAVEEKLDTIRHEYAHYMAFKLYGSTGHGYLWKKCCKTVGALPIICYNKERSDYYVSKHEKQQEQNNKYNEYRAEFKILHPVFGEGVITAILGEGLNRIASVSFPSTGEKKIAISWIDSNCKKV